MVDDIERVTQFDRTQELFLADSLTDKIHSFIIFRDVALLYLCIHRVEMPLGYGSSLFVAFEAL